MSDSELTAQLIVACAIDALRVDAGLFFGASKYPEVCRAREVAAWLLKTRLPHLSFPDLARIMQRAGHTGVLEMYNRAAHAFAAKDPGFLERARAVEGLVERRRLGDERHQVSRRIEVSERGLAELRRIHRAEEAALAGKIEMLKRRARAMEAAPIVAHTVCPTVTAEAVCR